MPQISLYIDEPTLKKIETAAKIEDVSLSKWVNSKLKGALEKSWPQGYFELFGTMPAPSPGKSTKARRP
jgi:hypothetical protein